MYLAVFFCVYIYIYIDKNVVIVGYPWILMYRFKMIFNSVVRSSDLMCDNTRIMSATSCNLVITMGSSHVISIIRPGIQIMQIMQNIPGNVYVYTHGYTGQCVCVYRAMCMCIPGNVYVHTGQCVCVYRAMCMCIPCIHIAPVYTRFHSRNLPSGRRCESHPHPPKIKSARLDWVSLGFCE